MQAGNYILYMSNDYNCEVPSSVNPLLGLVARTLIRIVRDNVSLIVAPVFRQGVLRPDKGEEGARPRGQDRHPHHRADLPLPL